MPQITPSIISKNFSDFQKMAEKVNGHTRWIHLDVADGVFAPNISWGDPSQLKHYKGAAFLEVHLMINRPEDTIAKWLDSGVERIFFHYESTEKHEEIISLCGKSRVRVGVALFPGTSTRVLKPFISRLDSVLLLGVRPGFYGSPFHKSVIPKILRLRKAYPGLTIEVDGGMNPKRARMAASAGAELIVSGSYIFGAPDIPRAIQELKKAVRGV